VTPEEPTQDPQDKAFGSAASRDQDIVDEREREGVTEDEVPDEPIRPPRAGGKSEPAAWDRTAHQTGNSEAQRNREEDPPA
jgi:hypothetical protein